MEPTLPPAQDSRFRGMIANSQVDLGPGYLSFVQNFIIRDGEMAPRPGLKATGTALPGAIQGLYQWELLDGTIYTCAFSNGDLYVLNWVTEVWTQYDLSAAGVTISTSADINCTTNRGALVITDGVNDPVLIDGPLSGPTYTTLTNAPVAHRTGVYYDKVFFWDIPGSENQFEWSDEGLPEDGYVGENQAWEFAQTDSGRILGAAPLNERLVILKEDSSTMLMGDADENFQTLAVREGLSETEGTSSGGSVVIYQGDVFCMHVNGPRRVRKGQIYESLHDFQGIDVLRDSMASVDESRLSECLTFVDRDEGHVGFIVPEVDVSDLNRVLVWHQKENGWTTWKLGINVTAVGHAEDNTGKSWVMFGDDTGQVYRYRASYDYHSDNGTAIEYIIRSRQAGGEQSHIEKRLVEVHFQFYLTGDFEGEIRPYTDGVVGEGKVFGLFNETGKKRYRRGFNSTGYRVGWELYANRDAQAITLSKATSFMSVVGMYGDWNG